MFASILLFSHRDKTTKWKLYYVSIIWEKNCGSRSNETCPKSKPVDALVMNGDSEMIFAYMVTCHKSKLEPHHAAAPLSDQFTYIAGGLATGMNTATFNLAGLFPHWAIFHNEPANQTCPGPGAASGFNFSSTPKSSKEKWANRTQKEIWPNAPKQLFLLSKQPLCLGLHVLVARPAGAATRITKCWHLCDDRGKSGWFLSVKTDLDSGILNEVAQNAANHHRILRIHYPLP